MGDTAGVRGGDEDSIDDGVSIMTDDGAVLGITLMVGDGVVGTTVVGIVVLSRDVRRCRCR